MCLCVLSRVVCFSGPTPFCGCGLTTLPLSAAGTTSMCTTATPFMPLYLLLSGRPALSLTENRFPFHQFGFSHHCFTFQVKMILWKILTLIF